MNSSRGVCTGVDPAVAGRDPRGVRPVDGEGFAGGVELGRVKFGRGGLDCDRIRIGCGFNILLYDRPHYYGSRTRS